MGTTASRMQKVIWMRTMKSKIKPEAELIKQFCLVHGATEKTAKEILELVK
jgi:hypothetical protein